MPGVSRRPVALARTIGSWSAGTRVTYVGEVTDHVNERTGIAVYAQPDKQRRVFYVQPDDLVELRAQDGLTRAQRNEG